MVVLREYRIPVPLSVEEYKIGQLYSVAEASKNETGGGEGIIVEKNEAFSEHEDMGPGQYTYKHIMLHSKVPSFVKMLAPSGSLDVYEEAWNSYPHCKTVYTNGYMGDNFNVTITTIHKAGYGEEDNVHNLSPKRLKERSVEFIDIANDPCPPKDYKIEEDPRIFKSEKTGRGLLVTKDWYKTTEPVMCCYKLYEVKFKWRGLQGRVESWIMGAVKKLLFNFHRQLFCWIDKYYGMTIDEIRLIEEKTRQELIEMKDKGEVRGTVAK